MKETKIKIDIVSDVVCPWCVVGYKRLEKAISELGFEDKFEIEWQPFELNPNMSSEGEDLEQHLANKYGTSVEQNAQSKNQLVKHGDELGFTFDYFEGMKIVNTRDAHILLDFAKESGKQTELNLRLMTAVFSEHKDISKREVLVEELKSLGLVADKAKTRLEAEDARENIQKKEAYWQSKGVRSVPTMVFGGNSALTGAQPIYVYKQVLSELIQQNA